MQKNKVFLTFTLVLLLVAAAGITAQSPEIMDNLLESDAATFGESAYMIAVGSGIAEDDVSIPEAVKLIEQKGWSKSGREADSLVTLGEFSFMVMEALELEGGIMYSLFPSPRYAVRELAFKGFVTSEPHPGNLVGGDDVLSILSLAVSSREANR
jgi:hypothetical protein